MRNSIERGNAPLLLPHVSCPSGQRFLVRRGLRAGVAHRRQPLPPRGRALSPQRPAMEQGVSGTDPARTQSSDGGGHRRRHRAYRRAQARHDPVRPRLRHAPRGRYPDARASGHRAPPGELPTRRKGTLSRVDRRPPGRSGQEGLLLGHLLRDQVPRAAQHGLSLRHGLWNSRRAMGPRPARRGRHPPQRRRPSQGHGGGERVRTGRSAQAPRAGRRAGP